MTYSNMNRKTTANRVGDYCKQGGKQHDMERIPEAENQAQKKRFCATVSQHYRTSQKLIL